MFAGFSDLNALSDLHFLDLTASEWVWCGGEGDGGDVVWGEGKEEVDVQ